MHAPRQLKHFGSSLPPPGPYVWPMLLGLGSGALDTGKDPRVRHGNAPKSRTQEHCPNFGNF